MTALPATQPLRALAVFDHVPAGCSLHLQRCDMHAPHLRAGEFAVIDTTDREPVNGELFLILQSAGPIIWQVVERTEGVWFKPLNGPRSAEEARQALRRGGAVYLTDGPLKPECLPERMLGRVIGIYEAPGFDPPRLPPPGAGCP